MSFYLRIIKKGKLSSRKTKGDVVKYDIYHFKISCSNKF